MNILIKNAKIVDCVQNFIGDVLVEGGRIKEVAKSINKEGVEVVDAKGLTLMPTFIDTHAHFREPGLTWKEDIETGSKAAVKGGFTGVCLMANTKPICSSNEVLEEVRRRGKEVGLADLHQCLSITKNFDGKTLEHLDELKDDKEIKAISDDGVGVGNGKVMHDALLKAKEYGWVVMSHAETSEFSSMDMRVAENMMTWRDVELCKLTGGRLHMCHVSTKESMEYIIREKEDVAYLINAIKTGMVDCIGTDHAPHTEEEKKKGSPGMVGLETAFSICYTTLVKENGLSLNKLSEIMSKNPSEILGMNKGTLGIGRDGDLVLVDLDKKVKIDSESFASKGHNTPFNGMEYYGEVQMTIKGGKIVYKK